MLKWICQQRAKCSKHFLIACKNISLLTLEISLLGPLEHDYLLRLFASNNILYHTLFLLLTKQNSYTINHLLNSYYTVTRQ